MIGDAVHNLRSAIDHAYWAIVSPFAFGGQLNNVQFPFGETAEKLKETAKQRLAHKVTTSFYDVIIDIKPHNESGRNRLLWLVHQADILDKHKLLTPLADYTRLTSQLIRQQVPDFPNIAYVGTSMNKRDVVWRVPPLALRGQNLGTLRPPSTCIYEKVLDVPVDIVIPVEPPTQIISVIPMLNEMVGVAKDTISRIRNAAP